MAWQGGAGRGAAGHGKEAGSGESRSRADVTGAELKALRKSLGLSLAQAAKQVEVSPRTWARWETSARVPPGAVKLFRIENKLEQPPD